MLTNNTVAEFTWGWGEEFLLKTAEGNFIWLDPDYGGDGSIKPYKGTYQDWCRKLKIPYGRHKGTHTIGDYCRE